MSRYVNTLAHRIGPVGEDGNVVRIGPGVEYDAAELGVEDAVSGMAGQLPADDYEPPEPDPEPEPGTEVGGGTITTETGGTLGGQSDDEPVAEPEDLTALAPDELRKRAKDAGHKVNRRTSKADLIALLAPEEPSE